MPKQVTPQAVGTLLRRQKLIPTPAKENAAKLSARRARCFLYQPRGSIVDQDRPHQPFFGDFSERVVDLGRYLITWHENPSTYLKTTL